MLSFSTYPKAPEQFEMVADAEGIDDLIQLLQSLKKHKDHLHLLIDNELDVYPLPVERQSEAVSVKSVRLQYADAAEWREKLTPRPQ